MKISREFILGDHTLNSHDLSDGLSIDIRRKISCYLLFGLKCNAFQADISCFHDYSQVLSWLFPALSCESGRL